MGFIFLLSAVLAFLGAIMMVSRRNAVYCLLFLLLSFVGSAGLFYTLSATFLAVAQVMVYAGAISVLFLFVLMFVNLRREGETDLPSRIDSLAVYDPDKIAKPEVKEGKTLGFNLGAFVFSAVIFVFFAAVILDLPKVWDKFKPLTISQMDGNHFGGVKAFGQAMMHDFPLHYEVVGLVVLVGVIGAVVLGHRLTVKKAEASATKGDAKGAGHHG